MMVFGTLKQLTVKTLWFQDKQTPEMYIVEFAEIKQDTIVQTLFYVGKCYRYGKLYQKELAYS